MKANSWAMAQRGLDSTIAQDSERQRPGYRSADIDDYKGTMKRTVINRMVDERAKLDAQALRRQARVGDLERRADNKLMTAPADAIDLSRLSSLGRMGKLR